MALLADLYKKYGAPVIARLGNDIHVAENAVGNFAHGTTGWQQAAQHALPSVSPQTSHRINSSILQAGRDTGQFAQAIASPVQGVVNAGRAVPALAYGALGSVTPGHTFKGNIQQFNQKVPEAHFATQATQNLVQRKVLPPVATTVTKGGELAGGLAVPLPGLGEIKALESARPLVKLAGYTAARAGEGYAYGAGTNLAQTGDFTQANKAGLIGAATAGIGNAVLSPKLVRSAVKDVGNLSQETKAANNAYRTFKATPNETVTATPPGDNFAPGTVTRAKSLQTVDVPAAQAKAMIHGGAGKELTANARQGTVKVSFDPETKTVASWDSQNPFFIKELTGGSTLKPGFVGKPGTKEEALANAQKMAKDTSIPQNAVEANARALVQKGAEVQSPVPTIPTGDYLKSLSQDQKLATASDRLPLIQKGKSIIADIKRKLVDSTAPIEDTLFNAQNKNGYMVRPQNHISPQIDRVYRAPQLAGQFAKDNGLVDVIKGVPDIQKLDQYLIAKHAPEVATATGRNVAQDAQLVKELGPHYEDAAQKVVQYTKNLKQYMVESGLISKELSTQLDKQYPNYVPMNRLFSEAEKTGPIVGRKGVANLSRQTIVQKLKGSERTIQNPTESILQKTLDAFNQGERNKAGQMLASYKDLPGFEGLIKEAPKGQTPLHSFSYLENGVKKTFETTPEIAQAAKLLDKQQLGFIGKVFALPVRLARVGITGTNIPFVAANIAKDQGSAFINSSHALQTSIANPKVFGQALWEAVGHGKEYENWVRNAGGGTSFDISRELPQLTVGKIRAGRNPASAVAYTVTHPSELLRSAENAIGRGEEVTRLQQFIGTRDALLKAGRTPADANILAAQQSRNATVNFARSGDWGKALNSVFLYMNAGIQGSRTLVRNLAQRPIQTSAKIALTVFTPIAAVTAWNLSDPERQKAYNDIADFEKENNLIIIPPHPVKDPVTGKWNVIKVPFSQEIANLTIPLRKSIEAMRGYDAPGFAEVAKNLLGSATSLNTQSPGSLVGQFIPQAVKPPLEGYLNKNLFTGQDIVPQYLNGKPSKDLLPNEQVKPNTSGTARIVGGALNVSPLKVEQFAKSAFGGVGQQLINASDTALNKAGVIPPEQIGGQSIPEGIVSRFSQATGGQLLSNLYDNKKAPPGESSQIQESKGSFYAKIGSTVQKFDTKDAATLALAKQDFKKSGKAQEALGGMVFRKSPTGTISTTPQSIYNSQLLDSQLISYKNANNLNSWLDSATKKYQTLQQQLKDSSIDQLTALKIQNQITDLTKQAQKYKEYGGFTKPRAIKKPKKPRKAPIVRAPRVSFAKAKSIKIRSAKPKSMKVRKPKKVY